VETVPIYSGFVALVDVLGSDESVVNAARVSFGARTNEIDDRDRRLLRYLARHGHYSPFRHAMMTFHVRAPEFVARQWYKHVVGAETTSQHPTRDHAWNEISGRYKPLTDFWYPSSWRRQSESAKQGSDGELPAGQAAHAEEIFDRALRHVRAAYHELNALGVAREQARALLPLAVYTEFYWTVSFQAAQHFVALRAEEHAQAEIRQYAEAVRHLAGAAFPAVADAWEVEHAAQ
jgi:thymidylate synthase (FAD)